MGLNRKPPAGNVRRVHSNGRSLRGVIVNKAGRLIQFESLQERALLLRLERDPTIQDYGSQPECFHFCDPAGQLHRYTPDFIVWRENGETEIHEVTLSRRRTEPRIRQRESAAQAICQNRGWIYLVHTEHTLPGPTELANLLALYLYRPTIYANPQVNELVSRRLGESGTTPLICLAQDLAQDLGLPQPQVIASLCYALWHGHLETNLNQLLFRDGQVVPEAHVWRPALDE